ncbi:MAG: BatD protein, partial [Flavobacteriaceae bacterium]|uniref:BatD family protein n=1 Tax=Bizionia echini TaxID=649333 RepID=UPI000C8C432F|nr:BatD protein [Flavobacteriaceae bacterium]
MKLIKHIAVILLVLSSTIASAQITFEAKVSKKKLGINERLRVDFEMNKDGDNFNPPDFSNFTVVGGPNQAVSNSWINGKRSYSKTYSYFLAPKRQGTFTINQAVIEIDGEIYKTTPISVVVTSAVEAPKDGNNADYIASENIHLVAEISDDKPFLNEAITVVYKLYVSPDTGVSNWREIDNPKYSDFWSQNIDIRQLKVQNGTYKGEDYRYVILRKTVLYPQKTG